MPDRRAASSGSSVTSTFDKNMGVFLRSLLIILTLACSGCRSIYSFTILEAKQQNDKFHYTASKWYPEEYGHICNKVRSRTNQKISLCIVDNRMISTPAFAYAFTGHRGGRVFILQPSGIDTWEIIGEDNWKRTEKEFFEKKRAK